MLNFAVTLWMLYPCNLQVLVFHVLIINKLNEDVLILATSSCAQMEIIMEVKTLCHFQVNLCKFWVDFTNLSLKRIVKNEKKKKKPTGVWCPPPIREGHSSLHLYTCVT